MNGIGNDYIAMKLYEARLRELERENRKEHLVNIALKRVRLPIRLPQIKIGRN